MALYFIANLMVLYIRKISNLWLMINFDSHRKFGKYPGLFKRYNLSEMLPLNMSLLVLIVFYTLKLVFKEKKE